MDEQITSFIGDEQLISVIRQEKTPPVNCDPPNNLQKQLSLISLEEVKVQHNLEKTDTVINPNISLSECESSCRIVVGKKIKHVENNDDEDDALNENETLVDEPTSTFKKLPAKEKFILILCTFTYLLEGCSYSLLAPFFPQEAYGKGMSPTLTGFVFSVFDLIILITSPIFGAYLTKLGPKFVVLAGVFTAGICNILFGILDLCPPGKHFIILSILCRSIEAVGYSSYSTGVMAIVTSAFPKDATSTFAILETANGIGLMVGPAIGGGLYELGGFGLPFYVMGACILINGSIVYLVIPEAQDTLAKKTMSTFSILRSPMVVVGMITICIGCLAEGFLDPTLANHLESFNLSVALIGLFFVIASFVSTVLSPFWGFLADRKELYRELMVLGFLVNGVSFLVIGPSSLLPFLPFKLWIVILGFIVSGAVFPCSSIVPLKCMLIGAMDVGFVENIETCAIVSGLLNSMFSLGGFLGPLVGGVLVEWVGYSQAYTIVGLVCIGMGLLCIMFFASKQSRCTRSRRTGYQILS